MKNTLCCATMAAALLLAPARGAEENAGGTDEQDRYTEQTRVRITGDSEPGAVKEESPDRPTVLEEGKDTVYVLDTDQLEEVADNWRGRLDEVRGNGYGGSGGPKAGIAAIYTPPITDFLEADSYLSHFRFDIREWYEPFIMKGGMGYGGVGNGVRLGGGGMGGTRHFTSENVYRDSIVELEVQVGYGCFLVEKAFVREKANYVLGACLGRGEIELQAAKYHQGNHSVFTTFDELTATKGSQKAGFAYVEIHGAATYTVLPFLHIGGDISIPGFISAEGFGGPTSDFISANPSVNLRIMFGILG